MTVLVPTAELTEKTKDTAVARDRINQSVDISGKLKEKVYSSTDDAKQREEARKAIRDQYMKYRADLDSSGSATDKAIGAMLKRGEEDVSEPERKIKWLSSQAEAMHQRESINQITISGIEQIQALSGSAQETKIKQLKDIVAKVGDAKVDEYLKKKAEIEALVKAGGPSWKENYDKAFADLQELTKTLVDSPELKEAIAARKILETIGGDTDYDVSKLEGLKQEAQQDSEKVKAWVGAGSSKTATIKIGEESVTVGGYVGYRIIGLISEIKNEEMPGGVPGGGSGTNTTDPEQQKTFEQQLSSKSVLGSQVESYKDYENYKVFGHGIRKDSNNIKSFLRRNCYWQGKGFPNVPGDGGAALRLGVPSTLLDDVVVQKADGGFEGFDTQGYRSMALYQFGKVRCDPNKTSQSELEKLVKKELAEFMADSSKTHLPLYLGEEGAFSYVTPRVVLLDKEAVQRFLNTK